MSTLVHSKIVNYLEGSIQGAIFKIVGFINLFENISKTCDKSPDYYGFLNLNGIGRFKVSLWKKQTTKVVLDKVDDKGNLLNE